MRHTAVGLPIALLLPLLVLAFGPGLAQWPTSVVGDGGVDAWGTLWFYWMTGEWLRGATSLAHNSLLFFPDGKDVYLHTGGNALDAVLATPLLSIAGRSVGYNSFLLLLLVSNGVAAWHLGRATGGGALGSAVAAVAFAMCPTILGELAGGRPTQALLAPLALCVAVGWSALQGSVSMLRAGVAGVLLFLVGLTYWFNPIFLVVATAPAGALVAWRADAPVRWRIVAAALLSGLVALVLALPATWPMLSALRSGDVPGLLDVGRWTSTSWAPLTREGVAVGVQVLDLASLRTGFVYESEGKRLLEPGPAAFSVVALLLAGLGLLRRRVLAPFVVMGLAALILSLGPSLLVAEGLGNPLYIWLSKLVPPLARMWWPSRAMVVFHVALVPLVAIGADWAGGERRPRKAAVGLLIVVLLGADLHRQGLAPLPLRPLPDLPVDHCLAQVEGALIELPANGHASRLVRQAVHGKPMFGGMLEDNPVFVPAAHHERAAKNSYTAALIAAANGIAYNPPSTGDRSALGTLGFAWVLVHREDLASTLPEAARPGTRRRMMKELTQLLGRPVWSDSQVSLYAPWGATIECAAP